MKLLLNLMISSQNTFNEKLFISKEMLGYWHNSLHTWKWSEMCALEPVCSKKRQKSPNQEIGLGNRGPLDSLNGTKLILNDEGVHSCSFKNDLASKRTLFPYSPNQFLGWDFFFTVSYSKPALALFQCPKEIPCCFLDYIQLTPNNNLYFSTWYAIDTSHLHRASLNTQKGRKISLPPRRHPQEE